AFESRAFVEWRTTEAQASPTWQDRPSSFRCTRQLRPCSRAVLRPKNNSVAEVAFADALGVVSHEEAIDPLQHLVPAVHVVWRFANDGARGPAHRADLLVGFSQLLGC